MPEYVYDCMSELGGCGYMFSTFQTMAEFNPNQPPECPLCKLTKYVKINLDVNIRPNLGPKTLGSLAEQNTTRMSEDARQDRWRKDHKYLFADNPLPRGWQRMGNPKDRKISTKQSMRDPKRKGNKDNAETPKV